MSRTVPIRLFDRHAAFVLGIAAVIAVALAPGLSPYWRIAIITCMAAAVLVAIYRASPAVSAVHGLAVQARMLLDPPPPAHLQSGTDDIGIIREALLEATLRKRDMQRMCNDMREVKRLTELGQQAAGVAHELNNPLGGILIYANLLAEDTSPDNPARANVDKIIRETERCRAIVKHLLDIGRQAPPQCTGTRIDELLGEALNNIGPLIESCRITVRKNLHASLPLVRADGCQLQEVFENLLKNAIEAIDGPGEVILTTRIVENGGNPGAVEVTIADTGPGITPEDLEHLFEPFYTTKRSGHGTGLGLSVSHSIIERHGGSITVINRPGGGASFTVRVPAHKETA